MVYPLQNSYFKHPPLTLTLLLLAVKSLPLKYENEAGDSTKLAAPVYGAGAQRFWRIHTPVQFQQLCYPVCRDAQGACNWP